MRGLRLFGIRYVLGLCMINNGFIGPASSRGVFGPRGILGPVPVTVIGVLVLALTARQHWQWARSPAAAARAEIEKLLSRSAGPGTWVTGDGDTRLVAHRRGHLLLSAWVVSRPSAYIDAAGHAAAATETFTFAWFDDHVPWKLDGAPAKGRRRTERSADTGELAELAGQFRRAELVPADEIPD